MCWRTYILFFQMIQTFGALLLQMKVYRRKKFELVCHVNSGSSNFYPTTMAAILISATIDLNFYIICTVFQFSASPPLRVIVPHYKKKKRGGGILSSLSLSVNFDLKASASLTQSLLHQSFIILWSMKCLLAWVLLVQYPIMNWTQFLWSSLRNPTLLIPKME